MQATQINFLFLKGERTSARSSESQGGGRRGLFRRTHFVCSQPHSLSGQLACVLRCGWGADGRPLPHWSLSLDLPSSYGIRSERFRGHSVRSLYSELGSLKLGEASGIQGPQRGREPLTCGGSEGLEVIVVPPTALSAVPELLPMAEGGLRCQDTGEKAHRVFWSCQL